MDPDSSLPRSKTFTIHFKPASLKTSPAYFSVLIGFILIVTLVFYLSAPAAPAGYSAHGEPHIAAAVQTPTHPGWPGNTHSPEKSVLAYPYPMTTVLVILAFLLMLAWLFYRARSEGKRKTQVKKWAG